jgi:hypothetical protein
MRILFFLVFVFALSGCTKQHDCGCVVPYQVYYLKATVVQPSNIDCRKPVLEFSEDSAHIRMITGRNDILYVVTGLPAGFAVANKKLYVSVALLKPDEYFICTDLGPTYAPLKITDAKNRE